MSTLVYHNYGLTPQAINHKLECLLKGAPMHVTVVLLLRVPYHGYKMQ